MQCIIYKTKKQKQKCHMTVISKIEETEAKSISLRTYIHNYLLVLLIQILQSIKSYPNLPS